MTVPRNTTAYERITDALRSAGMHVTTFSRSTRSQCPLHARRRDSLAINLPDRPDGPLLVHCFAGCDTQDVLAAIGLDLRDLYDGDRPRDWQPAPRRPTSPWDPIRDPEWFAGRCRQTGQLESDPAYWDYRADELGRALPRLGDFPGMPADHTYDDAAWLAGRSPAVKRVVNAQQVAFLRSRITACRNRARLLRGGK